MKQIHSFFYRRPVMLLATARYRNPQTRNRPSLSVVTRLWKNVVHHAAL
jgi:hypothetical protein